jgi:type III restriction enzyme
MNADGNISNYYPDFTVKTSNKDLFIVKQKALKTLMFLSKMARLKNGAKISTPHKKSTL